MLAGVEREDGTRSRVAVDAVFDSVSVATTFQEELAKAGVLFMPISEALQKQPELVKKYLGTVVPISDNFFATLNSAVFSDGSFVYVPEGVRGPMELSTYLRINEKNTGQFERTLIIADKGSYVSYLEGCTAPMRDENQLHAAVVELIRARRCRDQVLDHPELVSGRRAGPRRHLQFRDQAWRLPRQERENLARRVLFDRHLERLPAGRCRFGRPPGGGGIVTYPSKWEKIICQRKPQSITKKHQSISRMPRAITGKRPSITRPEVTRRLHTMPT